VQHLLPPALTLSLCINHRYFSPHVRVLFALSHFFSPPTSSTIFPTSSAIFHEKIIILCLLQLKLPISPSPFLPV
jgi:hypothetical protein